MDRALIFYSHIINWAHGRRNYSSGPSTSKGGGKAGLTFEWGDKKKGICHSFHTALRSHDGGQKTLSRKALKEMLQEVLLNISQSDQIYGMIHN